MTRKALLLINRHARKGRQQVEFAVQQLQNFDLELIEVEMPPPKQLSDTIRRYQGQVDLVIIGGGDGTLNAAIAGLIDTQIPLGLLPLGTANDLARTLQIPVDIVQACQVIATGTPQCVDVGWVNGQHFFNVASLGLSVKITRQLTKEVKQRWGIFAYAITAFNALWESRLFHAEVRLADGQIHPVKTIQIAVGNGRFYGGGMAVTSDAAIDDGRLDLYSLGLEHWWQMLALFPLLHRGHHASTPWSDSWAGQEFYVQTRRPRSINTDGEITTSTPAHFRVLPKALTIFTPPQSLTEMTQPQRNSTISLDRC
ncbi:MAG: lipid kinase [Thermosynechococcaceae cyanobacterium]